MKKFTFKLLALLAFVSAAAPTKIDLSKEALGQAEPSHSSLPGTEEVPQVSDSQVVITLPCVAPVLPLLLTDAPAQSGLEPAVESGSDSSQEDVTAALQRAEEPKSAEEQKALSDFKVLKKDFGIETQKLIDQLDTLRNLNGQLELKKVKEDKRSELERLLIALKQVNECLKSCNNEILSVFVEAQAPITKKEACDMYSKACEDLKVAISLLPEDEKVTKSTRDKVTRLSQERDGMFQFTYFLQHPELDKSHDDLVLGKSLRDFFVSFRDNVARFSEYVKNGQIDNDNVNYNVNLS